MQAFHQSVAFEQLDVDIGVQSRKQVRNGSGRICGKQNPQSCNVFAGGSLPQAVQPQKSKRKAAGRILARLVFGRGKQRPNFSAPTENAADIISRKRMLQIWSCGDGL